MTVTTTHGKASVIGQIFCLVFSNTCMYDMTITDVLNKVNAV